MVSLFCLPTVSQQKQAVNAWHRLAYDLISLILSGAGYRIRTCDPVITNHVLYQLS
jgi:hypothetical protein